MNRRSFLSFCAALPLVGWLVPLDQPCPVDADAVERAMRICAKYENCEVVYTDYIILVHPPENPPCDT